MCFRGARLPYHDTAKLHEAHMVILDGAAVVNMIKPRTPVSFDGYVTYDMVFDAFWKDSL